MPSYEPQKWGTVADWVYALSNVGIACAGWYATKNWISQKRGRDSYDLAEKILETVLSIRREISKVRSPLMFGWEYASRPGRSDTDMKISGADVGFAYRKRWENIPGLMDELEALLIRARVLWGDSLPEPFKRLRSLIFELEYGIDQQIRSRNDEHDPSAPSDAELPAIRLLIFGTGLDTDVFAKKIETSIKEFEQALLPHLGRS